MYCQECGSKLPETAKFCVNCGTKVWREEAAEEVKEVQVEESGIEAEARAEETMEESKVEVQVDSEAKQVESEIIAPKKIRKGNKKLLAVLAGVLVVLAVAVGGFFAYLENRTLYTLLNPELYFGECSSYNVMQSAPGESLAIAYFRSETDFIDKVLEYADMVHQVDDNLIEYKNIYEQDGPFQLHRSWVVALPDVFWNDYSFYENNADELTILYGYSEYYGEYEVTFCIEGYQNCEVLDVNLYERVDSKDNTEDNGTKPVATATPNPKRRKGNGAGTPTPTPTPTPNPKRRKGNGAGTPTPTPMQQVKTTATPKPQAKATATPKPQAKATATPVPTKAAELVAQKVDTKTLVQAPKNAFQDLGAWSNGKAVTGDSEEQGKATQYIEYTVSQKTIEKYMEMLKQNGFTEVDSYFFQYKSDPFVAWGFNCDYLPNADKVKMQYKDNVYCNLCIWSSDSDEFHLVYSSDLTKYDLGFRMDGSVADTSVKGPSAGAGLYRMPDGTYQTSDGRLSAALNTAMVLRDGKAYHCTARNEKNPDKLEEWLWLDDYYRNEGICFMVPMNYVMEGDIFQYSDFERARYYNKPNEKANITHWNWNSKPLFLATVDGGWVGPKITDSNFNAVTVRVLYYEKDVEAVYYIYAETSGTPAEIEALCAVSLSAEVGSSFDDTIYLSVGETYTIHFSDTQFGAKSNVYDWEVTDGSAVYIDGVSENCEVTAMKTGESTVTLKYRYTVDEPDVLTGLPSTGFKSKTRVYRIVVK